MSRLWQTVLSIWAWLVLVTCVLVWFPLMAVLRLVTAPFDRGRYAVGYLFRQIPVVVAALNPLWRFRCAGTMPADPRCPYVVVSNHESRSNEHAPASRYGRLSGHKRLHGFNLAHFRETLVMIESAIAEQEHSIGSFSPLELFDDGIGRGLTRWAPLLQQACLQAALAH